eukprot:5733506-Prymnesium_polylepis.1
MRVYAVCVRFHQVGATRGYYSRVGQPPQRWPPVPLPLLSPPASFPSSTPIRAGIWEGGGRIIVPGLCSYACSISHMRHIYNSQRLGSHSQLGRIKTCNVRRLRKWQRATAAVATAAVVYSVAVMAAVGGPSTDASARVRWVVAVERLWRQWQWRRRWRQRSG